MRRTILIKEKHLQLILFLAAIVLTANLSAQHSLEKVWETEPTLKFPEAVVFEPNGFFLYLSILDGSPLRMMGRGQSGR